MYKLCTLEAEGDINVAALPSSGGLKHISCRAQIVVKPPGEPPLLIASRTGERGLVGVEHRRDAHEEAMLVHRKLFNLLL